MTRLFLIVGAILAAMTAMADGTRTKFQIRGKWVEFYNDPAKRLTISADCVAQSGEISCQAHAALSQATRAGIDHRQYSYGANPGTVVCRQVLMGSIVMGYDKAGGQNAFCAFPDGSLLDTGTIAYYSSVK
jgi:hypothetical protein